MANAKIIVFVLFILFDVCFDIVCYYAFCIANILFFLIEIHALQLPVVSKHEKKCKNAVLIKYFERISEKILFDYLVDIMLFI